MPIGEYFKGNGDDVMRSMQKRYGADEGKRVFYATANKRAMKPRMPKTAALKPLAKTSSKRVSKTLPKSI